MPYGKTKVYYDGSHYIAIPHRTRFVNKRPKPKEELITVVENNQTDMESTPSNNEVVPFLLSKNIHNSENTNDTDFQDEDKSCNLNSYKITRKELFNNLYNEYLTEPKSKRRNLIINAMRPYFTTDTATSEYVDVNMDRRKRNLIVRRIRCVRKANLQQFNYFVTFTYNENLHTEISFKKKLKICLRNFSNRKNWRYLGVWERSPEKKRLHFHGLFHIPEGTMPGIMLEVNDYNFNTHKRQITNQNWYFNERFGRSDFELIENRTKLGESIAYILKYIEKTGERIVYSKGLPQFFISDILDDDIVCPIGMEDKKLLLFDDFICWDEGMYIGKVSAETINQLPKSN